MACKDIQDKCQEMAKRMQNKGLLIGTSEWQSSSFTSKALLLPRGIAALDASGGRRHPRRSQR